MKKEWLCLIVATGLFYISNGQAIISSGTILASAREDMAPELQKRHTQYMQETNHGLPFVEEISLRTETDRFDADRQEFLGRISLNGLSEMRHVRDLHSAVLTAQQKTERVYLHEALVDRYETIASIYQVLQELSLREQLQLVYEDKITVLKKMASLNVKPDLDELIKAEFDLDEEVLNIESSYAQLEHLKNLVAILSPGTSGEWQLDTAHFITPAQMELVIDQIAVTVSQNPSLVEKQNKIEEINAEYDLEKAESNQMLDYLQVRYAGRPEENSFNQEFSFGAGFLLPFKGSSTVKLNELKIEKNDANQEAQIYENELTRELTIALQKIKSLGARYRTAEQQWKNSQASFTLDQYSVAQAEGPFLLLSAKEMQLKREMALLDIQRDMLEEYLKVLDWNGQLSVEPQVNYLSTNLETY
ncbi:MAG TPA: hypothetical protein VFV79_10990 [Saprospiraceae bacterium]|nr:hypothetical protein [Saprospiraceae bacterium]